MPTVVDLGQRVKAKYPGAYDDLPDIEVGRRTKQKYPEYADFTEPEAWPARDPKTDPYNEYLSEEESKQVYSPESQKAIAGAAFSPELLEPVQKRLGLPSNTELYERGVKSIRERYNKIPEEKRDKPLDKLLIKGARAALEYGKIVPETIDFFTSPGGMAATAALGPAARVAPKVVGPAIAATMAPEAIRSTGEAIKDTTPESVGKAAKDLTFVGLPLAGLRRGTSVKDRIEKPVEKPAVKAPPVMSGEQTRAAQSAAKQAKENVAVPESGVPEEAARLNDFAQRATGKRLTELTEPDQIALRELYAENATAEGARVPQEMERLPSPPRRNAPEASSRRVQGQRGAVDIGVNPKAKPPKPLEEEFLNFRRMALSPEEEQYLRPAIRGMAERGELVKEVEPQATAIAAGRKLDPADVMDVSREQGIEARGARHIVRERANALNRELVKLDKELDNPALTAEERAPIDAKRERMERDWKQYYTTVSGDRTEAGRNLAMFRQTADNTLDLNWWLAEAKRSMRLPPGAELPEGHLKTVRTKVAEAQGAESKLNSALGKRSPRKARTREQEIADAKSRLKAGLKGSLQEKPQSVTPEERLKFEEDPEIQDLRAEVAKRKQELAELVARMRENGGLETAVMFWRMGLMGVKSHLRNVGGSLSMATMEEMKRIPASLADMAISVGSKKREVAGFNPGAVVRAGMEAASKGVTEAGEILRHGTSEADRSSGELHREWNYKGSSPIVNKLVNGYINAQGRTLAAEDKLFKVYSLRRSMEAQARVQALNEQRAGTLTKSLGERAQELVANPTEKMTVEAVAYADFATFNNENAASNAVTAFRGRLGPIGKTVIDTQLPFKRTPFNITNRTIDYSPVGTVTRPMLEYYDSVRNKLPFNAQKVISEAIGRGLSGTAILAIGWYAAKHKLATGTTQREPSKVNAQRAAGRTTGAVKSPVGDDWLRISSMAPGGILFAVGAQLQMESDRPLKDELTRGGNIGLAITKTMLEQPMLSPMKENVDALENPASFNRLIANKAGSLVPTFVSEIATVTNPEQPEGPEKHASMAGAALHGIKARLPGIKGTLPPQTDVLGNKPDASRWNAVNPFTPSRAKERTDPLFKEIINSDIGIASVRQNPGETDDAYRDRKNYVGKAIELTLRQELNNLPSDPAERKKEIADIIRRVKREIAERFKVDVEE